MKKNVTVITNKFDWALNQYKEIQIEIEVDDDVAHKLDNIKLKDLSKIARDKKNADSKPSLVIEWIGYSRVAAEQLSSIGHYLYDIKKNTRRKNAKHDYDFTRFAFGV